MRDLPEDWYPLEPKKKRRWNKIHLCKINPHMIGTDPAYFLSRRSVDKIIQDDPDVGNVYFEVKPNQLIQLFLLIEKKDLLNHPDLVLREGDFELQKRQLRKSRNSPNEKTFYRLINRGDGEYEGKGEFTRLDKEDIKSVKRLIMDELIALD